MYMSTWAGYVEYDAKLCMHIVQSVRNTAAQE